MLAKLKYLGEEKKALKDIEMMVTEQITRLKQEELYLKSLLRESRGTRDDILASATHSFKKEETLDDSAVNATPLADLHVQATPGQQQRFVDAEDNGEEDDEDDMDSGGCDECQNEEAINKDLMELLQQMQGPGF